MSKIKTIAKLGALLALTATAATAGTRDSHKYGKFFQNVKAEHVMPLLGGTAFVSQMDYEGAGEVAVYWFGSDGLGVTCQGTPSMNRSYGVDSWAYQGVNFDSKFLMTRHPLVQHYKNGAPSGADLIRYDAATGAMKNYWYQNRRYWEMRTGHLQTELPAVTWELCPDFPSAKSLGARVNKKQTAKLYNDLVRQDPGKRVRKPQYESKVPPIVRLDYDYKPVTGGDR